MAEMGLKGKAPVRRRRTTDSRHDFPRYPNLVEGLEVTRPDQVWVADITYVRLRDEFIYLAVVMDVFTRRVRGWELGRGLDQELTLAPLKRAIRRVRRPDVHLAALGIARGKPFAPDARMRGILENAAKAGLAQLRVQSFADRRPDRVVWPDRQWEWAALRYEDGDFNTANHVDLEAREVWFYQAIGASPAMFRRKAGSGSLYWLGLRDATGTYLDGGKTYKLTVPQPVPGKLFWSVTVYDAETRSQVQTDQGKAALRSMFELKDEAGERAAELYFGPKAPAGKEGQWIKTIPGKGWFVYFRVYGPEHAAFDGTWKPGDFDEVK
jgi:hypothetical protein